MKVGAFQLIYFTFLHNSEVIAYVALAVVSLILLIKKPTRQKVFFFVGFLVLTFLFEYQKHIVGDLAEQTVNTLYQSEGNYRLRWLTETAIYHLVPFGMWLAGWGLVALGIWNPDWKKRGEKEKMRARNSEQNDYNNES